jgi:hypothetical protein
MPQRPDCPSMLLSSCQANRAMWSSTQEVRRDDRHRVHRRMHDAYPAGITRGRFFGGKRLRLCEGSHWYQERTMIPGDAPHATRLTLVWLARRGDGRQALAIGHPTTCIGWQRQGFRLGWHWHSRPARPPLPWNLHRQPRRTRYGHAWRGYALERFPEQNFAGDSCLRSVSSVQGSLPADGLCRGCVRRHRTGCLRGCCQRPMPLRDGAPER